MAGDALPHDRCDLPADFAVRALHFYYGIATDRHVEVLSAIAPDLPGNVELAGAYRGAAAGRCLDKSAIGEAAVAAGIPVPWSHDLENGWPEPESLAFPLILKPKSIHRQRHWMKGIKLFVCRNHDELSAVAGRPEFDAKDWTLQELIEGPESNIRVSACFRDRSGHTGPVFTAAKLRQYPADFGSASLVCSVPDEEVADSSRRLLEQLDFQGIAGVEFKRSARTGELLLVEMNPRPSLWFAAATAKGYRLVLRQLDEWFGTRTAGECEPRDEEVVWRYFLKDFTVSWQRRLNGRGMALPGPDTQRPPGASRCWAVYDRRDPLPAPAEAWGYVRKALSRMRT